MSGHNNATFCCYKYCMQIQIHKCTNRQIHKAQKPQNTNREGPGHYNTKVVNVLLFKLYFPVPYRTGQNA